MVATVKVVVSHDGTAKAIVANRQTQLIKSLTTLPVHQKNLSSNQRNTLFLKRNSISLVTKLVDDDKELTDKYAETNTNPYVDNTNKQRRKKLKY